MVSYFWMKRFKSSELSRSKELDSSVIYAFELLSFMPVFLTLPSSPPRAGSITSPNSSITSSRSNWSGDTLPLARVTVIYADMGPARI